MPPDIVVRGLRAPPKPAMFKQYAGHGDPALQYDDDFGLSQCV